jgi:hypothetical protein
VITTHTLSSDFLDMSKMTTPPSPPFSPNLPVSCTFPLFRSKTRAHPHSVSPPREMAPPTIHVPRCNSSLPSYSLNRFPPTRRRSVRSTLPKSMNSLSLIPGQPTTRPECLRIQSLPGSDNRPVPTPSPRFVEYVETPASHVYCDCPRQSQTRCYSVGSIEGQTRRVRFS